MPQEIQDALKAKGHKVTLTSGLGVSQALSLEADGKLAAQSDPRVNGSALGF